MFTSRLKESFKLKLSAEQERLDAIREGFAIGVQTPATIKARDIQEHINTIDKYIQYPDTGMSSNDLNDAIEAVKSKIDKLRTI